MSPPPRFERPPLPIMVHQHHELAAHLWGTRRVLATAPHLRLHQLARTDERLRAHLEGLRVAGAAGLVACREGLASPAEGTVYVATVLALAHGDGALLASLVALAEALPDAFDGVSAGLAWAPAAQLRGVVQALLGAPAAPRRALGLVACAAHRVPPGEALVAALADGDPALLATACRVAGVMGGRDLLPAVLALLARPEPAVRMAAARAAVRLGDRHRAPDALRELALGPAGPHREPALGTWLKVAPSADAQDVLRRLGTDPASRRLLVRGCGLAGDPVVVPWLLRQMAEPGLARLAGEAFTTLTGADLPDLDLEGEAPPDAAAGPDDDPAHADVALDEDEGLPWPDVHRLAAWWQAEGGRFPAGARCFFGGPPTPAHALQCLVTGPQRGRGHAAEHLALREPDAPQFDTTAPTWRQRRWLADAGAPPDASGAR